MIHHTKTRTVAIIVVVLLPCCVCSCAYRDGLKSLARPGDLFTCTQERHVCEVMPCDPCYGFHPTCWSTWPEWCPGCPPPADMTTENVSEDGKKNTTPMEPPSAREVVPAPEQEPPTAKPPEPPRPPQSKAPAAKLPDAPLPPPSQKDGAESPSARVKILPPPPEGVKILPPPPSISADVGDTTVLAALRLAISSRATRSRPLPIQADQRLGKTNPPRWEETTLPRFRHAEPLVDCTYSNRVAASCVRDSLEP